MEALYLLVPFSVAVVFFAIWVFFKASDSGQFDDMVGPAMRILQDDDRAGDAEACEAPQHDVQKTGSSPLDVAGAREANLGPIQRH